MTTPKTCNRPVFVLMIASCPRDNHETGRVYLLPAVLCTAVVVMLSISPYIEWLDTFCLGVQMPPLAFLVSC